MECSHCGDSCNSEHIVLGKHFFCCLGCKTVFEILNRSSLGEYYGLESHPGIKMSLAKLEKEQLTFLDQPEMVKYLIRFENNEITSISLSIPQIHCSACIWLLEHLYRLESRVTNSSVNFTTKQVDITYRNKEINLRQVVELLKSIGYSPDLSVGKSSRQKTRKKRIYYQIGVAGFCFGNIMLMSFPEYLSIDESFTSFRTFFAYLSLLLSVPVIFYSGVDYIKNAFNAIRQRFLNMDVPIALGIITLFLRSGYEVVWQNELGYFDSLSGLVFFLLLGKWFQQKTYDTLSFDRDYKSYFPIAVNKRFRDGFAPVKIEDLEINDEIELRNHELIPADGILQTESTYIDYSFVTGESALVFQEKGAQLFAGGKQIGTKIIVKLNKKVENSYLTQLWNQDAFTKTGVINKLDGIANVVSQYFTIVVLFIAIATAVFWLIYDPSITWNAVTAVLIVACPCALALSIPFTLGTLIRVMGRKEAYLKDASIIEKMSNISDVILDKTGTITYREKMSVTYTGNTMMSSEKSAIKTLVNHSIHPLSRAIFNHLQGVESTNVTDFKEIPGKGLSGVIGDKLIQVGSANYFGIDETDQTKISTQVFVAIDTIIQGRFELEQEYRTGLKGLIKELENKYNIHLLSGDDSHQEKYLKEHFGFDTLFFNQSPMDKLNYIQSIQKNGGKVLMIGDGLNDAGALKQSDVGIALSENVHQFSPASDVILSSKQLSLLPAFLKLSIAGVRIIKISFVISFLYNLMGLFFAVTGVLSPVIAAILMPISSITVVSFTTLSSNISFKMIFNKSWNNLKPD